MAAPMPTPAPAPTPTLIPTTTPTPTAILEPTPTAIPIPTPTPPTSPTLAPTPAPEPVQIPLSHSLEGLPRVQSPLFSYENEEVYSKVRSLVSGQNLFVADFYRHLAQEAGGNLFYSPYSLYSAMAVVYAGAAGNTASELQHVMGIKTPSDRFHETMNSLDLTLLNDSTRPGETSVNGKPPPVLAVANGLWIQDGLEVQPDFLDTVTSNYGIGLAQVDFHNSPDGAVQAINQWVDEATRGKLQQAISRDSITDFTSLVVTNAVYFKGDWKDQFREEDTTDQPFYLLDGLVAQVPMMFQSNDYRYRIGKGYQAVELPYTSGFSMLAVMPDEGTFEVFEDSLTGDRLAAITDELGWGEVDLRMPRFKLEYRFSAKKGLQALGLNDAFDRRRADFGSIADALVGRLIEALWIEDAVQKAFVEVNEEGSEAAAATAFRGGVVVESIPPPPVYITIDRPFIFLLRHSETGTVLFMGRVLNPDPEAPVITRSELPPTPTPTPEGPREPPAIFMGIATLNGAPPPLGTEINAFDDDRVIGQTMVGEGGEFVLIVERSEGPITFTVGGAYALERVRVWLSGNITENFDFHAASQ